MSREININFLDTSQTPYTSHRSRARVEDDGVYDSASGAKLLAVLPLDSNTYVIDPAVQFKFESHLGQGSYASVFGAKDSTGKAVAVKILDIRAQPSEIATIAKEIKILQDSAGSPFFVQMIGAYNFGSKIWIVMEYCAAGSLESIIKASQPFSEDMTASIIKMVCYGLLFLHSNKKIHRDIKPANILVDHNGVFKLADFGLTAVLDKTLDQATSLCGTPYFVSPEVCSQRPYDHKTDSWSLGILIYYMLTGAVPPTLRPLGPQDLLRAIPASTPQNYELPGKPALSYRWMHQSERDLQNSLGPGSSLRPGHGWSDEVKDFLRCCLQIDPTKRWEVAQLLQHCYLFKIPRFIQPTAVRGVDVFAAPIEIEQIKSERVPEPAHKGWPCSSNYVAIGKNIKSYIKVDDYGFSASAKIALTAIPAYLKLAEPKPITPEVAQALKNHGCLFLETVFDGTRHVHNSQIARNQQIAQIIIVGAREARQQQQQASKSQISNGLVHTESSNSQTLVCLAPPTLGHIPQTNVYSDQDPSYNKRRQLLSCQEISSKQQRIIGSKSPQEAYNQNPQSTESGHTMGFHQAHNQQ